MIIIFVMFVGRLGLLTFGLAILARRNEIKMKTDLADLVI